MVKISAKTSGHMKVTNFRSANMRSFKKQ
jgi:hypothetical protein